MYRVEGESIVTKAMSPTSLTDGLELWFLLGGRSSSRAAAEPTCRPWDRRSFICERSAPVRQEPHRPVQTWPAASLWQGDIRAVPMQVGSGGGRGVP